MTKYSGESYMESYTDAEHEARWGDEKEIVDEEYFEEMGDENE